MMMMNSRNILLMIIGFVALVVIGCASSGNKAVVQSEDQAVVTAMSDWIVAVDTTSMPKYELIFKTPFDSSIVAYCDSFQVEPIYDGKLDSYLCYDKSGKLILIQNAGPGWKVFINNNSINYPDPAVLRNGEIK